jgi:membrane protein YdbS with pleckstrin-like domain
MYDKFKDFVVRILNVPPEPLDPMGGENSLRVFRAAPNYYRYRLFFWYFHAAFLALFFFGGAISLIIVGFFVMPWGLLMLLGGLALFPIGLFLIAFSYATLRLDYEMRWYKVTDRSLRVREGVLTVREMTMTFANIQNIAVTQGPLQRYFRIANLEVKSAGGGSGTNPQEQHPGMIDMHVAYFRGVDNAEEIRDIMLEQLRRLRDTGLGDLDDPAQDPAGPPAPAIRFLPSEETGGALAALRAIRDEARLFRQTAEALK